MKLDFSEFHPLDHHILERRCRELPGGVRRHISLWHDYQAPDPVGALSCRFGRHDWVEYWEGRGGFSPTDPPNGTMCGRCYKNPDEP